MIELPQLWLPDRLRQRREDERLLRGRHGVSRRWMPGYPCCCGGACPGGACRWSGGIPSEFVVDFGVGGWTDRASFCSECDEIAGEFILAQNIDGLGNGLCSWSYSQSNWCQQSSTWPVICSEWYDLTIGIQVQYVLPDYDTWIYRVDLQLMSPAGTCEGWNVVAFESAESDVAGSCTEPFSAGKVALTKTGADTKEFVYPCDGAMPGTIYAWPNP